MPDTSNGNNLEAARTRLETALSGLAQSVASTRGALDVALTMAEEKAQMSERINTLEQENLKLHEQVAALALQPAAPGMSDSITALEQEKTAIEQNYQMLKDRYAELQNDVATTDDSASSDVDALRQENTRLSAAVSTMEREKATLRTELDKTIAELEAMLESA
tara:strand:+ start:203 stop:694 length:492 start_codon:yes stop_codon:yes gene_type:complete